MQDNAISLSRLLSGFSANAQFWPFPPASDREYWKHILPEVKEAYLRRAEQLLGYEYPPLTAVGYLSYTRTGNRSAYEKNFFDRRKALCRLAIGECLEYDGRFIDDIINGIWHICEESTWVLPAHLDKPLPGDERLIDIFAAETGALLSYIYYALGDKLEAAAPGVSGRINAEVESRIIAPYLENDYWWMSFGDRRPLNWNTWCNANCLPCFLILCRDPEVRTKGVCKITRSLDRFIDSYGEDGGCDEGVTYWERAGGCLFEAAELLGMADKRTDKLFEYEKLRNIFYFPYRLMITGDYYVNFADASAVNRVSESLMLRIARKLNDEVLFGYARRLHELRKKDPRPEEEGSGMNFYRQIMELTCENELTEADGERKENGCGIIPAQEYYFESIEVMTVRSGSSLFLAAKGGHNDENHNHNDVGNFIVYKNDLPMLIDVGVETYTRKTFSPQRYEIWTMQSQYHNLPVLSGAIQKAGAEYRTKYAAYQKSGGSVTFSMDLSDAYGDPNILKLVRTFVFDREKARIELTDAFRLAVHHDDTLYCFMSVRKPLPVADGFTLGQGSDALSIKYDTGIFTFSYEEISINDKRLSPVWGDRIYRTVLRLNEKKPERIVRFTMM